jgi:ankyrin repeat protein
MMDSKRKKYKPKEYFSGWELGVAESIYYGDKKRLDNLLIQGRPLNHVGQEGFTFLMYAIMLEEYSMTEYLLKKGADPNMISPLMKNKYNRGLEDSQKLPEDILPLETCCYSDYPLKWMKLLVKYGADLNDNRVIPPLHQAIMSNNPMEKVEYLLACGANIDQTYQGDTPIMTAASIMNWKMINYLLDRGANVSYVADDGVSLGFRLQEYRKLTTWTPEGRENLEHVIDRLKEKGVQFPVRKQKPKPFLPE